MADDIGQPEPAEESPAPPTAVDGDPIDVVRSEWRRFWQVPMLLVGLGVLMLGVAFAVATSPDPDFGPVLRRAEGMIERERYQEAIELLNNRVYPWLEQGDAVPVSDRRRYHLAKARAIYHGQSQLGISDDRNHVSIVREYLEAERLGGDLAPRDSVALADTFLSRGEIDAAMNRLRATPQGAGPTKDQAVRRAVELLLSLPIPDEDRALTIIAELLGDPETGDNQRVWALERQARIRLDQGFVEETVTRLLREMPRLTQADSSARARLHLALARAYRLLDADREASKQIDHASRLSASGDPHYPSVLLERALLDDRRGETELARDGYTRIVERHAGSVAYPRAMLGLGETHASLGDRREAIDTYSELVAQYASLRIAVDPSRSDIEESLLERASESIASDRPEEALDYAGLAERIKQPETVSERVLEARAVAHEQVARLMIPEDADQRRPLAGLDPSTRAEVQRHLIAAGVNRRLHAERFVLTDLARYADSLWRAAELFDQAGDQREALQAFRIYADAMPSDTKYAEARFRAAEALRSLGEYSLAADEFTALIEDQRGVAGADIGAWAEASYVPLAQAYLYDEDPANDGEAEALLLKATDGTLTGNGTRLFRDALAELAYLYDRTGRHERAIERLEEIVARYPEDPDVGLLTYRLAESHRRLGDEIGRSVLETLPPTTRAEREALVVRHREEAIIRYDASIRMLEDVRPADRGILGNLALRNAHFYLGDCLLDLERHTEAIRAYDRARERYPQEAATLVALVQIVNAHMARGDLRRAATANERAKRFYLSLPEEAWDDPNLPMDRKDWETWLDSSAQLFAGAEASS